MTIALATTELICEGAKNTGSTSGRSLTRMAEDGKVSPTPIDRYECCHDGCNSFVKQSTKIYVERKMLPLS
jgi:hypothetical protein